IRRAIDVSVPPQKPRMVYRRAPKHQRTRKSARMDRTTHTRRMLEAMHHEYAEHSRRESFDGKLRDRRRLVEITADYLRDLRVQLSEAPASAIRRHHDHAMATQLDE